MPATPAAQALALWNAASTAADMAAVLEATTAAAEIEAGDSAAHCQERLAHYTISYRATLTDAWTVCSIGDAAADALGPLLSECSGLAQYVMVHSPQLVSIL